MSLRSIGLVVVTVAVLALGVDCSGTRSRSSDPKTAKEKQRREADSNGETAAQTSKWGGWRYQGDRNDCFFVVGRKCFKTEAQACDAARCRPKKCETVGGGPASIACK